MVSFLEADAPQPPDGADLGSGRHAARGPAGALAHRPSQDPPAPHRARLSGIARTPAATGLAGKAAELASQLLLITLVPAAMGTGDYGQFALVLAVVMVGSSWVGLGGPTVMTRHVPAVPEAEREALALALTLRLGAWRAAQAALAALVGVVLVAIDPDLFEPAFVVATVVALALDVACHDRLPGRPRSRPRGHLELPLPAPEPGARRRRRGAPLSRRQRGFGLGDRALVGRGPGGRGDPGAAEAGACAPRLSDPGGCAPVRGAAGGLGCSPPGTAARRGGAGRPAGRLARRDRLCGARGGARHGWAQRRCARRSRSSFQGW